MELRLAVPSDVDALFRVRTSVRENHMSKERLAELGITNASISDMIIASPCAWVFIADDQIVGFSMIDKTNACVFAAFVLPKYEARGIGTQLMQAAENELFKHNHRIWLETTKGSRAAGFYRSRGWGDEREVEGDQIRLSKTRPTRAV